MIPMRAPAASSRRSSLQSAFVDGADGKSANNERGGLDARVTAHGHDEGTKKLRNDVVVDELFGIRLLMKPAKRVIIRADGLYRRAVGSCIQVRIRLNRRV